MPITIRKFLIGSAQVADDAIGSSAMIGADVVMGYHIVDDAIGSEHIEADAISYAAQVKDGIIGHAELTAGLVGSIAAAAPPDSIGTTELKEPAVGSSQIYDDAIGSQHIDDDAIGSSAMIAADVVMGYHIVDDAIGSEHLEADAVGSSAQIADDVIHDEHIADDAIGSSAMVADNVIGHDQMLDAAVGYTELTTGLQGSLVGAREQPYAGDDSEVSITGTTPGTVKTASILKNAYCAPIGSIKIAAQLKASAGTYEMQILLGTVHVVSFTGTETAYKIHTGSFGVGGESDGVLALEFTIKNSQGAGVTSNKLVDIITVM